MVLKKWENVRRNGCEFFEVQRVFFLIFGLFILLFYVLLVLNTKLAVVLV